MLDLVDGVPPIGLAELLAGAALQQRVERKYLAPLEVLGVALGRLGPTYQVLDIDGRRLFRYETTYFDTPELRTLRDHVQGRRRRFKLRRRTYVDSGRAVLEVKLKGYRGMTVKHALPVDAGHQDLDDRARAFFRERVRDAYGVEIPVDLLAPVLRTTTTRLTLASIVGGERLTADIGLDLQGARLDPRYAVVEVKSTGGSAMADRALREVGVRPVPRLSKFVLGIGFARADIPLNDFTRLRRYFEPADVGAR